ncbi:hypothetical protein [Phenylobacterium sp.]|uniref:hypothetical protein n=1 Tax=Phenylobacterium sp. TaxID=1871053 RepID=UPI002ED8C6EC
MDKLSASRRAVLGASALLAAGPAVAAGPAGEAEAKGILERYHSFGDKASGGPGDEASGAWLEGELTGLGYAVVRQPFDAPAFEGEATLATGQAMAGLIPQAIVTPTLAGGITGPLHGGDRDGGIALLVLPYARWSTALGEVERRVRAARGDAVVLVTTGPTGEACALNAPSDRKLFDRPVAVLAPKEAAPFVSASASGEAATLSMPGRSFRRPAYNVTATLTRRPSGKWLVLSTPRSGWFGCAGERGTGLAVWLMLAGWAAKANLPVNVALVATSGHEYEYQGGELYIAKVAPKPDETALWVHLGANVAARDWHERGPLLAPLPSADPQRFLLAAPKHVPALAAAFAGQPGLEKPYPVNPAQAAGELGSILHAGYDPAMGIFGSHRFHHTRSDDLRCVSPALIPPVVAALSKVISGAF